MMNKNNGAFEQSLKEALEQYEVPYNSADWAQMEKRLDSDKRSNWTSSAALYLLLLGGGLAIATTVHELRLPNEQMAAVAVNTTSFQDPTLDGSTTTSENAITEDVTEDPKTSKEAPEIAIDQHPTKAPTQVYRVPVPAERGTSPENITSVVDQPAKNSPKTTSTAVSIRPSITEGCPGATVEFAVANMPTTGMHLWNFGDGSFSNKPSPAHTFSKAGTYEVMLSHSSTGGGSIENKPASDLIVIHEAPEAKFKALKQEYGNTVPSVHFENRSQGAKTYVWDFGDGTSSNIAHPDHVFKKKGIYPVVLTVTNSNGCIDRTEETIRIEEDYDLYAAKTFSPNGDGRDDIFIPEALKTLGVKFTMTIYDTKSGQLVHETSDIAHPWNGRISNKGEPCSTGDYMWMVEMKDGEKLGGSYTGTISLLR